MKKKNLRNKQQKPQLILPSSKIYMHASYSNAKKIRQCKIKVQKNPVKKIRNISNAKKTQMPKYLQNNEISKNIFRIIKYQNFPKNLSVKEQRP